MHSLLWQEQKVGVLYILIHSHELNAHGRQFFISISKCPNTLVQGQQVPSAV